MVKFDFKWSTLGLSFVLALLMATVLNIIISDIWGVSTLPLGKAWIVVLISIFIVYFFIAVADGKIEKKEIITMIFLAAALFASGWALKHFAPEIFSSLPDEIKNTFSSIGVK